MSLGRWPNQSAAVTFISLPASKVPIPNYAISHTIGTFEIACQVIRKSRVKAVALREFDIAYRSGLF